MYDKKKNSPTVDLQNEEIKKVNKLQINNFYLEKIYILSLSNYKNNQIH